MATQKPVTSDYGGDASGSHCYEQQLKNWIIRDDPNRDKSIGSITRSDLNARIKKETGR